MARPILQERSFVMDPDHSPNDAKDHPTQPPGKTDLRSMASILLSGALSSSGAAQALLTLRDKDSAHFSELASSAPLPSSFAALTLRAVASRHPIVIGDPRDTLLSSPELIEREIVRLVALPAMIERRVEAVLVLGFKKGAPAPEDPDHPLYASLTALVEGVLLGEHLTQRLRRTEHRLGFISRLYRALSAVNTLILMRPDEDTLLSGTIQILIEMGGFTAAGFYEVHPDSLRLGPYHITDPDSDRSRHPVSISLDPASPDSRTGAVRAYRTRSPIFINDLEAEYRRAELHDRARDYRHLSFRSAGLCPVFQGGVCTKVLAIVSTETGQFSPEIQDLILETSSLLSLALDQHDTEARRAASEERLTTLINHLPDPVIFKDGEGRWKTVNTPVLRLFGLEGRTDWEDRTDEELATMIPHLAESFRGCFTSDLQAWEARRPLFTTERIPGDEEGELRILEGTKVPLFFEDGRRKGLVISLRDVTRKRRDEEIRERYARIFDHTGEGILITDRNRRIVDVNPAFTAITGYSREEVIGLTPRVLRSERQNDTFYEDLWNTLEQRGSWEGEIWNRKKSGEVYCEWLSIFPLTENGTITHYIGIFTDISHRKAGEMRTAYLATHDILTGIPNRGLFLERLDAAWQDSRNAEKHFAVGILDLDYFKEVNDSMGHGAGDQLLKQVSRRMERVLKSTDTLARLGGDEYGLILKDITPESLPRLCERLLGVLLDPFDLISGHAPKVRISASLGITQSPSDGSSPENLLAHADLALYRSKARGRNTWTLFEASMEEQAREIQNLREDFSRALSNGSLCLHYQPQMDFRTGRITGVEALVRWQHPERGLLHPPAFIGIVESSHLTVALGKWVLERAIAQQEQWSREGLTLRVSVNIGARSFLSEEFVTALQSIPALVRRQEAPTQEGSEILLEVPEPDVLKDPLRTKRAIDECRKRGLLVSLDDFGTGQASIRTLQDLEVDEVKIDRSFIRNLMDDPKDLAIVANLLRTARMLLIRAVAKGAESETEGQILAHLGCPILQGSVLSLPMPPEEIPPFIASFASIPAWTDATLWPEFDMEELSLLMVARAGRDLNRRMAEAFKDPSLWQEWRTSRGNCPLCRWIDYTIKLLEGRAGQEFWNVVEMHQEVHRRIGRTFGQGVDRRTLPSMQAEIKALGESLVDTVLTLCGKAAQNLSRSLL